MKKNILSLLFIIIPVFLFAQPYSNKDKMLISSRIDTLLMNYMQKSALTEPGASKLNNQMFNDFKNLFTADAMIFDDINARFDEKETGFPYKLEKKTYEDYFIGIGSQFPKGLLITNTNINISYDNLDKGEVKAALARKIEGITSSGKYFFSNHDTLLIKIIIQPDMSVKIKDISAIGPGAFKVANDKDNDGVTNSMDECAEQRGKIALKGCPDDDDDGVPNSKDDCPTDKGPVENSGCPPTTFSYKYVFSALAGGSLNLNKLEGDVKAFENDADPSAKSSGTLKGKGFAPGFNLNASIAYYFSKKKQNRNKGISLGLSYTHFVSTYEFENVNFVHKANDGYDNYHSIITMIDGSEKLAYNVFNVPLLFRYKSRFGKLAFEVGAGPSFVYIVTRSHYVNKFNFEGIYQYDTKGLNIYDDNYDISTPAKSDLVFTETNINNHNHSDANDFFENYLGPVNDYYKGYFGLQKRTEGDIGAKDHTGFALNGNVDLFYHISSKKAIKASFFVLQSIGIKKPQANYEMIDKIDGSYNSIFDNNESSIYTSFGLNLGLIFGI